MTIKWDADHPDSNTCVEQWHYNVNFLLINDRCSSDDFLNRDDGSIDMIVYKVEGARSNFGGISSISSMGNAKDFEWLRNRTKPTARQISISKSLTESMLKQNLCWTGHFIPPPPTENASIEWPVQVNPWKKTNFPLKRVLAVNRVLGAPRARQKGPKIEAIFRTPFTLRTPFKGNLVKNRIYVGLATLYPLPQQRMPL